MKKLLGFLATVVLSTGMALGQSQNGTVTGVVTDATGAVVANATVTLTGVNTGVKRTATTDSAGVYDIEGVPPQDYKVTVAAAGFATTTTGAFNVSVGSNNKVNAKISVQENNETVEVAANSLAGINLENAEQSQVINSEQITELPTITRNPYALTNLSGFATVDPTGTNRGTGVALGGARSASTEILLDGLENTGLFSVGVATTVPLDAVQEYRVITSNYGPEYGRASGGVVNVATRAGTNTLHGTLWEFYRPSTFVGQDSYNKAQTPAIPQGRFVRNEFGFVVGGHIIKDKLFFFGGNEWTRVRSSQASTFIVPTSQFIGLSNANTQSFFSAYGALAATPVVTYTLSDVSNPAGGSTAYNSAFCVPDKNNVCSATSDRNFLLSHGFTDATPIFQKVQVTTFSDAGGGTPQNTYNPIGRIDFDMTDKTQMYGRYVLFNETTPVGANTVSPYQGYSTGFSIKSQNLVYGLTHTFNSHWTSQVELGLLRYNNNAPLGDRPVGPTMFVNSTTFKLGSTGNNVVFPGYVPTSASSGLPSGGPQNDIMAFPVFTYTKGRHTQTFGGQYTYIRDNHIFPIYSNAQESLVQSGSGGALKNFQSGVFNFFQANIDPQGKFPCAKDFVTGLQNVNAACTITTPITQPIFGRSNRYQEFAVFYNEEWKATPRLTLNAGLRYEVYGTQHNKNPNLDSNFYPGTVGSLQDRIRAGKILRATDTAPAGVQNPNGKLWRTNYKQFAPRIGFAYDVLGDGKTSLRGGFGVSYERNFGNVTYNVALNPPGQFAISLTTADNGGASFPIATGPTGPFSAIAGIQKALPQASARAVDPNIKPAYMEFFDLGIEHQLNPTLSVGAAYQGARGIHGYSIANLNRTYYGQVYENDAATYTSTGTPADTNRLNNQYTGVNVRSADSDSYYHGLNLSARGSNIYNSHLTVTANYTFAHSTDNNSNAFASDGGSNGTLGAAGVSYFDPFNKAIDYGNSDNDVKHRIAIGLIYTTPAFGTTGLVKQIVSGWEFGAQYTAQTGQPFTMYDTALPISTGNGIYPRARFLTPVSHQRTGPSKSLGNGIYDYIDFPTRGDTSTRAALAANTNYGYYADPKTNFADMPTIIGGQDTFGGGMVNGGMSARNSFRGPGFQHLNADLIKNFKIHERYGLQLRAEAFDALNHPNEFMVFSGTNDVDGPVGPNMQAYAQTYKDVQRQLQLAAKITF